MVRGPSQVQTVLRSVSRPSATDIISVTEVIKCMLLLHGQGQSTETGIVAETGLLKQGCPIRTAGGLIMFS